MTAAEIFEARVERAAKALERFNTSGYEWTDDEFETWWSKDSLFIHQTRVWPNFTGTRKAKLLHEVRLVLTA